MTRHKPIFYNPFRMKLQNVKDILRPYKGIVLADYCTVKEAAQALKISPSGVYYRIMAGKIPVVRFGKQLLIKKTDVR